MQYLLRHEIADLAPEIIAIYIQATLKVFGYWATELAESWEDEKMVELKSTVETIINFMSEFASSHHIEVQERVRVPLPLP